VVRRKNIKKPPPCLSVVMPVFNEETTIKEIISKVLAKIV